MKGGAAGILVLLLGASASSAGPDPEQIDEAVQRGVRWLLREQKANGAFGTNAGQTALGLMALRHSGVRAEDKACVKAARYLARVLPDGTSYGAALGIIALIEQRKRKYKPEIDKLVKQLAGGQCRNGQWTYAYRATAKKSAGDNSNTQLVILALAGARLHGYDVPDEVFAKCGAFFRKSQNEDGGFGYSDKQRAKSYGSMTAGGAMALVLCAAFEQKKNIRDPSLRELPEVKRALRWLGQGFDPTKNKDAARAFGKKKGKRGDNFWKHYWLWSLERAGEASGAKLIGGHDWYAAGAAHLLANQRDGGEWRDPEAKLLGTCFALLFLKRSTRAVLTPPDRVTTPPAAG